MELATLAPAASLNRFNLTFQNFIRVFTQPAHPLVIFLDDLQWADEASLRLIELLMTQGPASQYLFLIGAYRNNEVGEVHPLSLAVAAIKQAGTTVNHIYLAPLALPQVTQLLAGTLHDPADDVGPLTDLVLTKTGGNPFFINQFLHSLYEEKLLILKRMRADPLSGGRGGGVKDQKKTDSSFIPHPSSFEWHWDLAQIQRQGITDNVVELMAGKLRRLQVETQAVLKLAACLGNQFDLETLVLVYEKSPKKTALDLWPALLEGLVLPLSDAYKIDLASFHGADMSGLVNYKFAHDRIQQAAYSLILEQERPAVHRQVGRLLLGRISPGEQAHEERIFDIVNQLNLGRSLIDSQEYDLSLSLYVEATEAALLNGHFDEMEQLAEVVLQQAKTLLDRMKVYEIKVQADTVQNKFLAAVKTARHALKLLGHTLPEQPGQADIILGLQETQAILADLQARTGKQIEALSDLPEMTDPDQLAAMRLLSGVTAAAFIAIPELYPLIVFKLIKLSIQYGLAAEFAFVCTNYAVILCGIVGDIETGYAFGQLAARLLERFKAEKVKTRTFYLLNCHIRHWKEPLRASVKGLAETYQVGLETGDFETAGFAALAYPFYGYFSGKELNEVEQEMVNYGQAIDQIKQETASHYNDIWRQVILNLLGRAEDACRLVGESYDEEKMAALHLKTNDRQALAMVQINKLILCYLLGKNEQALENAVQFESYSASAISAFHIPVANFYGSLSGLAHYPFAGAPEKAMILNKVAANQEKMQQWAQHAPMNHLHRYYLVEAERARILDQTGPAIEYYQQAIAAADENEYSQEEALGYELVAKFYLARGLEKAARTYMIEAYYGYLKWGARAKTDHLLATFPQLLAPILLAPQLEPGLAELQAGLLSPTMTQSHPAERLDLVTVLKATQAITTAANLADLLETLLRIIMQNAGAQQGWLLLPKTGQAAAGQKFPERWLIEAEATVQPDRITVLQSIPVKTGPATALPLTIINYVTRTREAVVLDDTVDKAQFIHDPYLLAQRPKSALCLPLLSQGQLKGLIYLENNLTKGIFTLERLELLKLLAAPAAIAIENALLAAPRHPPFSLPDLTHLPPSFFIPDTGERLTHREIEILALLAADATNRTIAGQLVVSRDTVKTHLKHIFAKLGVASRAQAIARARELGLL
ncbi:MAG: AAA family ATPase [Chloroflexi bacterium]|nr:AAA family ATPase [Chloroflexota bacterium]